MIFLKYLEIMQKWAVVVDVYKGKGFYMIIQEPNTWFYDYTEEELNDFVEYKKDFRKKMLIHTIEECLNELNDLCHSATFDGWYYNFKLLKDSF